MDQAQPAYVHSNIGRNRDFRHRTNGGFRLTPNGGLKVLVLFYVFGSLPPTNVVAVVAFPIAPL